MSKRQGLRKKKSKRERERDALGGRVVVRA